MELLAVMDQSVKPNFKSFIPAEPNPKSSALLDVSKEDTKKLQNLIIPFIYLNKIPKQHSMSLLLNGFNHWIKLPIDKVNIFEEILSDMYDTGTMLDDLLDDSISRRDIPASHIIYGSKRVILAYNAQLLLMTEKVRELDDPTITRWFHIAHLHYLMGQNQEICWSISSKCPTMPEYYDLIRLKLQHMYYFIIRSMQYMVKSNLDLSTLLALYTQYYQFQNDYCILCYEQYWKSKGFGDDISDGKFTLPIIHAVNSGTMEGDIVLNILRQHTKDVDLIKYCISLLEKLGSFEYAKLVVSEAEQKLRAEIDRLGGNVILEKMIDNIKLWKNDEKFTDD